MQIARHVVVAPVITAILLSGCQEKVVTYRVSAEHCPEITISAEGFIESYKIILEVENSPKKITLVPNIDMPQDVSQYVKYMKEVPSGVEIGIGQSKYVKDVDLRPASPSSALDP